MANRARTKPGEGKIKVQKTNPLENLEVFYEKNKKPINTLSTIVLIAVVAVFGYFRLYLGPREDKAGTSIAFAQRYFQADSLDKALNGDGQHLGFLRAEKKFSGTKIANLCHYYCGICYLHLQDFNNAVKQLNDFDGKGTLLSYAAWGAIGDAYMEMGQTKKGIEFYSKAAANKDDMILTPTYLYREGIAYEKDNQPEEAKKAYIRLRDEYPQSMEARDVDRTLARLGVLD